MCYYNLNISSHVYTWISVWKSYTMISQVYIWPGLFPVPLRSFFSYEYSYRIFHRWITFLQTEPRVLSGWNYRGRDSSREKWVCELSARDQGKRWPAFRTLPIWVCLSSAVNCAFAVDYCYFCFQAVKRWIWKQKRKKKQESRTGKWKTDSGIRFPLIFVLLFLAFYTLIGERLSLRSDRMELLGRLSCLQCSFVGE